MRSVRIVPPRATALLLVLMFIFADLSLPQTMEGWSELEDETSVHRSVSYHAVHADTYITAAAPTTTYNTSSTGVLADGPAQESRLLLRFPMNYTSSDTVHEASIDLECTTEALGPTELTAYVANMDRFWNGPMLRGCCSPTIKSGRKPAQRPTLTEAIGNRPPCFRATGP